MESCSSRRDRFERLVRYARTVKDQIHRLRQAAAELEAAGDPLPDGLADQLARPDAELLYEALRDRQGHGVPDHFIVDPTHPLYPYQFERGPKLRAALRPSERLA